MSKNDLIVNDKLHSRMNGDIERAWKQMEQLKLCSSEPRDDNLCDQFSKIAINSKSCGDRIDIEDIWNDFSMFRELEEEVVENKDIDDNYTNKCVNCGKDIYITDTHTGDEICVSCGYVFKHKAIDPTAEWISSVSETGVVNDKSRCGFAQNWYSPVSNNLNTSVGGWNSFHLKKWINRTSYTHKEKSFWEVDQLIESAVQRMSLNKTISETAKHMWGEVTKSGTLKRASNRKGMIACVLMYSCAYHKASREPIEIARGFGMKNISNITKGDKIIRRIFHHHSLYKDVIFSTASSQNMYDRMCSYLNLPYCVVNACKQLNDDLSDCIELAGMAPKSICSGIIGYTVKHMSMETKKPTKSQIAKTVGVCPPTMNKVLDVIEKKMSV